MTDSLTEARAEIDRIDREMKRLFTERFAAVRSVLAAKDASRAPIRDRGREEEIKKKRLDGMEAGILRDSYERFLCSVMDISVSAEEKMRAEASGDTVWVSDLTGGYPVVIRRGLLGDLRDRIDIDRKKLIVTDAGIPGEIVGRVREQFPDAEITVLPAGEACKTVRAVEGLWHFLEEKRFCRTDCVIALGGGSVSDVAGFATATYCRGIDCYVIPTTLLSAVDASVGGKTAVDFAGIKNSVGCFSNPRAVWTDPDLLESLPKRQLAAGFAEAIKVGLTSDAGLFDIFRAGMETEKLDEVIRRAVSVKAFVVERDPEDRGIRKILNFGHTVGHALESFLIGGEEPLLHGECVALGMLCAVSDELRSELLTVYRRIGLPTAFPVDPDSFSERIFADKKRSGDSIDTVWVNNIGNGEILGMTVPEFLDKVEPVIRNLIDRNLK